MTETGENRLRRLRMRSWRRGTKEMDLILGPYADARLGGLAPEALDRYEALLEENDQDLYLWVSRGEGLPEGHLAALREIRAFHGLG
ncbi:succinate dehydrogenase assembly factor 2 [Amaricoccus solimangrovi]|uniref:FAD assembly factor SdhE n=1 Tax=Amaricoccus solimangrovi TaxID=2589815 RepID=A0A501WW36_9RHOB|nr:succinate dehydrogenase assembly factor 2 [Amaricoccus solimangrovi]TPE52952.1 succinate dehydrogenase assembly factor 2 [Amaricoccus solimangrovi]